MSFTVTLSVLGLGKLLPGVAKKCQKKQ